jgi:Type II secretion system (T2SS), protein E, N-terminal domain
MSIDVYKEWLGIPESVPRPPDHYQLMRVPQFEDDTGKIRGNYKKLNAHVRKYATGKYLAESQNLMNELAKAMLCLTDAERKREYDESLGREFEPERDEFGRQPLLDVLVRQGHLSRDQKREVEQFANARGLTERDAVVQMKLVKPDLAAQALASQLGLSYVDLEDMLPEDDILDQVPRNLVKKHTFLPLFIDDDKLLIACVDQPAHELEDELRLRYGVPVRPVVATPRSINQALGQYYAPGMRGEAVTSAAVKSGEKPGKGTKPKKSRDSAPARSMKDLSETQQEQRRQMGILMICASIFVPMLPSLLGVLVPQFRLIMVDSAWIGYIPWLTAITAPLTAWFVTQVYWK